jgi:hypothetical protein
LIGGDINDYLTDHQKKMFAASIGTPYRSALHRQTRAPEVDGSIQTPLVGKWFPLAFKEFSQNFVTMGVMLDSLKIVNQGQQLSSTNFLVLKTATYLGCDFEQLFSGVDSRW